MDRVVSAGEDLDLLVDLSQSGKYVCIHISERWVGPCLCRLQLPGFHLDVIYRVIKLRLYNAPRCEE